MSANIPDDLGPSTRRAKPQSITAKEAAASLAIVQSTDAGTSREACLKCGSVASFANDYNAAPHALRTRACVSCGDDYLGPQLTHHRLLKVGDSLPPFHPPIKVAVIATCTVCTHYTKRLNLNAFVEKQQLLLSCPRCFGPHSPAEKSIFRVELAPQGELGHV
jgi:hypothetical protein